MVNLNPYPYSMITWQQYCNRELPPDTLQPVLDWLNDPTGQIDQPYPSIAVRLPDFWWFCRRHHYGRSGHGYACPLSHTLNMWIYRFRGHDGYWVADLPAWLEEDRDLYEAAYPQIIQDGVRFVLSPKWFRYTAPIEKWCDRKFNQFNHWLWRKTGKTIARKPLGNPIDNTNWKYSNADR